MSNLTSASNTEASVSSCGNRTIETTGGGVGGRSSSMYPLEHQYSSFHPPPAQTSQPPLKKKRNLPGNPDPEAEVIALSPKTLMATNRFICEICNKGFQRDQNLQLHRRGHNLPWKLKQRSNKEVRKKVYVCPEPSCVHHDPSRALGDLTGIKKHFSRKHGEKKWKCEKCSKRYAVQSDWKAHSKICGTREYRCDCGTLFSRRDSFITHRAFCDALAEESSRSIAPNISSNDPRQFLHHGIVQPSPSSTSNPNQHSGFFSNLQIPLQFDPFLANLKKEHEPIQQPFPGLRHDLMMPPWIGSGQDNPFSHQPVFAEGTNPSQGPGHAGGVGPAMQSFQQAPPLPPAGPTAGSMSATALLQKAAQMGHVYSDPGKSASAVFGLALSSSNAEAASGLHAPPHQAGGPSLSLMQEMVSSTQLPGTSYDFPPASGGSGGGGRVGAGGSEGLTRDFLGLRPLSQSEIFDIAGLGNCMSSPHDPQSQHFQKPWQG
ncbi:hypothetical protein CDL15_Pgr005547 [Punica granatum]|uniref:C2H2-type domain-containing protein n=1 Tax=Punica granatum TaxID=22663 RepID=A0A218WV98_PUNGR|nr:hypothetical protein CDL15_Pgr005547 [Punica granatum]